MNTDAFEKRLLGDEDKVSRDEAKLGRDEAKLDGFAARLGVGPDLRLAQTDAGNPYTGGDAAQLGALEQAGALPPRLPPSMADFGGPQMGAPSDAPPMGAAPYGAGGVGISQRLQANVQGAGPVPGSVPLSQTPQAQGIPRGPGGPAPDYITNPGKYVDPSRLPPSWMANAGPPPPGAPRPMGGGGSGDFGVGAANKALLGTYDDQRAHMQQGAEQHAQGARELADARDRQAAFMEQRARDAQQHADITAQKQTEYLNASDKLNDAYAKGEIDPNRAFHNADTGTKVAMGIAAFLGAIVPGVKPLSKLIFGSAEEDTAAQKEAYDRKGQSLKNRDTLFGHFMKVSGDSALARAQTTSALIDSQKVAIQAQAERLGIPEGLTNAKIATDALNREQRGLQKQIAERAQAAAGAHAAAVMAQQQKAAELEWQHKKDLVGFDQEQQKIDIAREGKDGKADKEREAGQVASTEFNQQMDDIIKSPVLDNIGVTSSMLAKLGPRLAPDSTRLHTQLDTINTQILQAVGKVAKDADGKPNIAMIERLEERFGISPSDTKEQALAKIQGARTAVNALARQQGANAPRPDAVGSVDFTPDGGK